MLKVCTVCRVPLIIKAEMKGEIEFGFKNMVADDVVVNDNESRLSKRLQHFGCSIYSIILLLIIFISA